MPRESIPRSICVWYFAYGSNLNSAAVSEWCRHYKHKQMLLKSGRVAGRAG